MISDPKFTKIVLEKFSNSLKNYEDSYPDFIFN